MGSDGIYLSAPGKIILFGEHAVVYGRVSQVDNELWGVPLALEVFV